MEQIEDMFVKPERPGDVDKVFPHGQSEVDVWDSSRDPDTPDRKRKTSDDRQPESPPEIERKHAANSWHREKDFQVHPGPLNTDSPASYPKHTMSHVEPSRYHREVTPHHQPELQSVNSKNGTPSLTSEEDRSLHGGYDVPAYHGNNYHNGNYIHENGHYQGHTPTRNHGHYLPDMEPSQQYAQNHQQDAFLRPRRWACDYCNVATFVSYEEACAHEEACAGQYFERYGRHPHPSRGPVPQYDRPQQQQHPPQTPPQGVLVTPPQGHGGNLSHGNQEVGGRQHMWGSRGGPPMPPLGPSSHDSGHHPHHQYHPHAVHHQHHYHHQQHHGYPGQHHSMHHQHHPPHQHHHHGYQPHMSYGGYHGYDAGSNGQARREAYQNHPQKRLLLAMATDQDSLSDRQCYVRSEMVEIFAASEKDVSARHSKGAQKLTQGQVGIRCVHCAHLRPRDRAERAVCYPSSISRIYQTVADMQRFHFEQCREIPPEIRKTYKSLKTTRPRGVGSPQTYWVQSAKLLDLVDTKNGIQFGADMKQQQEEKESSA
mmetsp:Transcript_24036/g.66618  ORF Transcript_24036/g.66618 Transcript_24036/m.66618 type:complete len:540 (-) Transcript_24036:422-2041(-)|eukprot:CAMPEP_0172381542 /NCGR_PEP_ID=MMETSP1060-20121228/71000_1 /TAXON_ID=37318 /ORGANISM="Pseudo-nitzschia pungens, Strain cf. cingulata" /LENGTH=539 /DNA_ID=CAMNT_0013109321 /DNA_START=113 /DNA_END=1732 /DNA_ORIENTATION=-